MNRVVTVFLLVLFCVSVASAAESKTLTQKSEPVTLQLKWKHNFQFAGYYAAIEQGYFADEGLDVTINELNSERNIIEELVNGNFDYAIGGSGILHSYANGAPIKALAAIFQHDALVFLSNAQSGIISPYEMAGKRILFDGITSDDAPLHALLSDAGLSSDSYQTIAPTFDINSLVNGDVDVMSAYMTDQPFALQQQGFDYNIIKPQNYGFDFYGDILYTSQREIDNHPGRSERFRNASIKGWQYALTHQEELIQLIKNKYLSESSIENLRFEAQETNKLILPDLIPIGTIALARIKSLAETYASLNLAKPLNETQIRNFVLNDKPALNISPEEQAWLNKNRIIRVGVDRDFAPYEWVDAEGNYMGLTSDYMKLLESRLGIKFDIINDKPWHEIQTMASRGELAILSCLNSSPERAQYLHFTPSYVTNPYVIVNVNRNGYIGSLNKLDGKKVAVERGYYTQELLATHHPDIELILADNTLSALHQVATGEADAYVGDAAYANYSIKQADLLNLQFSGQTPYNSSYRVGIHHNYPELYSLINKALHTITEQEHAEIKDRWMGLTVTTHEGIQYQTALIFILIITVVFLFFLYRLLRLRNAQRSLQKSAHRLQAVIDASPIPHALYDTNNNITYLNQAFTDCYGYTQQDIPTLEQWWKQAYPDPVYRSWVLGTWQHYMEVKSNNREVEASEVKIKCKNGEFRHALVSANTINEDHSSIDVVNIYDITERKQAEERLQLTGRIFNETHEGITITDANAIIIDVNPTFTTITGYSREDIIGQPFSVLQSGKQSPTFYENMWQDINATGYWHGELWNRKKNGQLYAESLTISTLLDDHDKVKHYLGLFSDITEYKQQQQKLEEMAHYDVLTRLPNRALFSDRFNQAVAHTKRNKNLLVICFLDLDEFKPVNDSLGHGVGDQLLIEVAQRIQESIREEDTVSRIGGDEFALLLTDIESFEHCEQTIQRIHQSIAHPFTIEDNTISISASSGITLYPNDDADLDTLMRHADQAMYQAKLAGRNRYHLFNAHNDQKISQQYSEIKTITDAFEAEQFSLYYQPKVNMKTGAIIGAEALLRWIHPEQGIIPPLSFLPVIENTKLEISIGNWVIDKALEQLNIWHQQELNYSLSINISPAHILSEGFVEYLDKALSRHPEVPSHLLEIEVLETSILGDINNTYTIIKACRDDLGLTIALDDFGTGFSSLSHLRHLPVNTVKIDQTFVRDIIDDPNDYAIVDGVIGLSKAFHRTVIAEGVETTEHGLMLILMGCLLAQGYGVARPMPAKLYLDWCNNYQPNPQWLALAQQSLSTENRLAHLIALETKQWLRRLIEALESQPGTIKHWPIMDEQKCHCAKWLLLARQQHVFSEDWLAQLNSHHSQLHDLGNELQQQYQEEPNSVQSGIAELKSLGQQTVSLLEKYL